MNEQHTPEVLERLQALRYSVNGDCYNGKEWELETIDAIRAALAERTQQEARPNDVDDMCFVERWAVHHASKPTVTAEEALSVIAHYPPIRAITESYKDGKRPETFDPYAEIERLKALLPTSADSTAPMQPSDEPERNFEEELLADDNGPPLIGRWHHGNGVLVSGSIRIAQWDCDTNPTAEFRNRVLDWMCASLNEALAAPTQAAGGEAFKLRCGDCKAPLNDDFSCDACGGPEDAAPASQAAGGEAAMNDLRRRCAEILREDPETWPRHGDAPKAIAAAMSLLAMVVRNDEIKRSAAAPAEEAVGEAEAVEREFQAWARMARESGKAFVSREIWYAAWSAALAAAPAAAAVTGGVGCCPNCRAPLERVTQGPNSMLNTEQFDAIRAGDWFCRACPEPGKSYRYFWDGDLTAAPAAAVEPTPCATCSGRGVVARSFRDGDEYDACPECNMPDPERAAAAPEGLTAHPDDEAVDRFAAAMKEKLAAARAKGRSGWDDPKQCTTIYLSELLLDHIAKGDPVDVANFAMMLHQRGSRIESEAAIEVWRMPATPDAKTAKERKPLTPEHLERMWLRITDKHIVSKAAAFALIREYERVHGIGDQP